MATRTYSGSIAATSGYTNQDGSGTTKFNFYYTVTQDLAANTSTIDWQVHLAGGGSVWYMTYNRSITLNGSSVYSNSTRTKTYVGEPLTGMSGSLTVNHSSNGAHAAIPVSWRAGVCMTTINCTGSGSIPLTTIPRATTPTVSTVTIGSAPTFDFSARADSSYTHTLTYSMGSASGTVVTKTANATYSGWTAPAALANQIPNATSGTITFTCETFNGNTSLGTTTVTTTATVPNTSAYKPGQPTATYENTTKNYLSALYLASLSAVKVTNITATANGGATIVSYSTTFNGATYTGTSFTTGVPSSARSYPMRVTVTDSRGRTNYRDYTITYYAYSPPTLTATASRSDSNGNADEIGNYAKFAITGAATSVKGSGSTEKNSIRSGKIQYKQSTASSYTTVNISGSGLNLTYSSSIEMSADYAWDIIVSVTDGANKTVSKTMKLSIGYATMDFYDGGKGIAFGTTATKNGFECAMDAEFTGGFKANGVRLLGGTTTIANGTNLNTLTTLGEYVITTAGAKTCTNTPWGTAASNNALAFRLTVERSLHSGDSTYLRQTLFPFNNANGYKRWSTNSGSTWTGWFLVETTIGNYATKASPTFTGTPKAPTAASGTNTTQIATTAFVQAALLQNVLTTTALEASTSSITSASSNGSNRVGSFKGGFIRIGDLVFVSFYCKALMSLAAGDYWTIARGFPKAWATTALSASFFKTKGAMNGYINTDGELIITLDSYSVATGEFICVSGFYIAKPVTT